MKLHAKKSLGQNFLTSVAHVRAVADAGEVKKGDIVLEIGPGKGVLTAELLSRGARVIAIEKDNRLIQPLQEKFATEESTKMFQLVNGDALEISPATLKLKSGEFKVVANIPYYITGAFLRHMLSGEIQPACAALLLQKEVAERIARSKKESLLSLSVKAYGQPKYVRTVPRGAFSPAPNVDSAILSISNISRSNFMTIHEERSFFETIRAGFSQKRKYLARNLEAIASAPRIAQAFEVISLNSKIRGEDLPISVWLSLSKLL